MMPRRNLALSLLLSTVPQLSNAQKQLTPPSPGSHAFLIVAGIIIAAFIVAVLYILLAEPDIRRSGLATFTNALQPLRPGLDLASLSRIPVVRFADVKEHKAVDGDQQCAVCLEALGDDELCRLFPHCSHFFHQLCVDRWLGLSRLCPICRANLSIVVEEESLGQQLAEDDGGARVDSYTLRLPADKWSRVVLSHRRAVSLSGVCDGREGGARAVLLSLWSTGRFSGRLVSFVRSLSGRRRGEEERKREGEEVEAPLRMAAELGVFRRAFGSMKAYQRGGSGARGWTEGFEASSEVSEESPEVATGVV